MAPRILAVDDDDSTLALIRAVLKREGYRVVVMSSASDALAEFRDSAQDGSSFDLVLSDYYMPGMAGDELLQKVRRIDPYVAFMFLTANNDVDVAVQLVRSGADDHLVKPILPQELVFRVGKNLREKQNLRIVEQTERERELLQMEMEKLVNWRALYAAKDISQTEQMIGLLSRTVNQSGGYLWVDLLESAAEQLGDDAYRVDKEIVDMILTAGRAQRNIFEYITFVGGIESVELHLEPVPVADLVTEVAAQLAGEAESLTAKYARRYSATVGDDHEDGIVHIDLRYLKKVLRELLINAVKYSPKESRIIVSFDYDRNSSGTCLEISVRNTSTTRQAKDAKGEPIVGIPYDYSELVFDLFYTIDNFPVYYPEEEWSDGTGLFLARKLLKKQGGWIRANNGVDYTGQAPATFVKFTVTLPVEQAAQEELNVR